MGFGPRFPKFGLVVAILLVVILSLQVRSLRTRLVQALDRAETLPVGTLAPVFTAATLEGDSVLMGRTARRLLPQPPSGIHGARRAG